ncbi:MAG TPA: ATP-binding protein [Ignavibacteriales bacterium]|nr:ATP-binding protein [Ignavibacteriales bacterium]
MKFTIERKITIWFALISALGFFFTYQTFKGRVDYIERGKWIENSYTIQSEIQSINNHMQQIEIQSHHYLLTGKKEFLKSYLLALDSLNQSVAHFSVLTKGNSRQQDLLGILNRLKRMKLERNQALFQNQRMWKSSDAQKIVPEGQNQNLVDSLRIVIDQMDLEEDKRMDRIMLSQQHVSDKGFASLVIMVFLFLSVIGIFYFLIIADIKKRKKAELNLKKNEAFLYMIFNEAKDALFIINPKTNMIESCNKAAVKMFDVQSKEELFNTFGSRFRKYPLGKKDLEHLDDVLDKEDYWTGEVEYISKSGRQFWGAGSLNKFEFNLGIHWLFRLTDVTDKKNSEQVLKSYAEALEENKSRLQALTSELLVKNNELKKSELALKQLNLSKDKFFSILAHDMRSPFSGLLGVAEYMARCYDLIPKDEIKELSEAVYLSAKKVYGLLNNLLEWSRLQMGKIEYLPSVAKLGELAEETVDLQMPNAETKGICLKNEISSQTVVFADQNMVSTVLRNLVSNAVKFTNRGGEVRLKSEEKGHYAEISISDTGIGMSREVLEQIFRIDSKYTSRGTAGEEGTGLGLILCKELIDKNKGGFRVESHPGKGTVFTFTLPLLPKEEPAEVE